MHIFSRTFVQNCLVMIGAVARNELGKRGPKPSRNGWNVWRVWTGPQLMNLGSKMEEEAQSCSELHGK